MKPADFLLNLCFNYRVSRISLGHLQFYFIHPSLIPIDFRLPPTRCKRRLENPCGLLAEFCLTPSSVSITRLRLRCWLNYFLCTNGWEIIVGFTPTRFVSCQAHLFRWVQGALTYSPGVANARLLRIPASWGWVATPNLN